MNTSVSLLTIAQQASTFITGQFGTLLVIAAVAIAGLEMAFTKHGNRIWMAVVGGAVFYSAAWGVSYFTNNAVTGVTL